MAGRAASPEPPRLLYVAAHVPPLSFSASLRARGFCRYLPACGWGVVLVTPAGLIEGPRDYDLLDGWPVGVEIEPVRAGALLRLLARRAARGGEIFDAARVGRSGAAARGLLRRANVVFVPDVFVAMERQLVGAAVAAGRRHGVRAVLATSPPESSLLAGAAIARRLGVPYLADLRDAWTLGPYAATGKTGARLRMEARQERRAFEAAARIFCVSETMRSRYAKAYPDLRDRFAVLENGYDDADFDVPPVREATWNLLHAGSLKSRERLASALRVAEAFASAGGAEAVLEFAGEAPAELRAKAEAARGTAIRLLGVRPHRETVARMRGAGALLLLVDRGEEVVTGKLAEYVRAGRPIFALAPGEGEVAHRLSGCAGAEVVPLECIETLPQRLEAFLTRRPGALESPVGSQAPTRAGIAQDLARHLDDVTKTGSGARLRPAEGLRAGFVLVTKDRPRELARALDSVRAQEGPVRKVVVVDDGSRDAGAIAAVVAEARVAARLVRLERNSGVAAARNAGARACEAEALIFLDDDAVFTDAGAARRVEDELGARPEAAVLAFRIVREGGGLVRREFPSRALWRADWPGAAPYFCGGACAVRRAAFEALGGFDETFFYALEELDFSLRAAASGLGIRYVPHLTVLHTPSRRAREEGAWFRQSLRSRWVLAWKDLPAWSAASHLVLWNAYLLARGLREGSARAALAGLMDGMRAARGVRRAPVPSAVLRSLGRLGGRTFY